MAAFDMIDMTSVGFYDLYDANETFFKEVDNWFFLKNDKEASFREGCVWAGTSYRDCNDNDGPVEGYGAAVLVGTMPVSKDLRSEVQKQKDHLVRFKLKDEKTEAYIGIMEYEGVETVGFVIKNKIATIDLPFSQ